MTITGARFRRYGTELTWLEHFVQYSVRWELRGAGPRRRYAFLRGGFHGMCLKLPSMSMIFWTDLFQPGSSDRRCIYESTLG